MRRPWFWRCRLGCLLALVAGCRENLSAPSGGRGPDVEGPVITLRPGQDTLVDSTGVLNIVVGVTDRSLIATIDLRLVGGQFGFNPVMPGDSVANVVYPIALSPYSGSSFAYSVRAVDVLNYETVTDTVTVTVK